MIVHLACEALRLEGTQVVQLGCFVYIMSGAEVHLVFVDHDQHLPVPSVHADASEIGASVLVMELVVMDFVGSSDNHLVYLAVMPEVTRSGKHGLPQLSLFHRKL